MNKIKFTNVGIYGDVDGKVIKHKDDRVTVQKPFVKWVQNSGTLAFRKIVFTGVQARELMSYLADGNNYAAVAICEAE